jgi:ABC-type branched-subunit amino acid transport system substrate-binding protein
MRALLLLLLPLAACTGIQVDYEMCSAPAQCRDAFGRGWTCNVESGHCEEAAPLERCSSEPAGILTSPEDHADRVLLGSVFQHGPIFNGMVRSARLAVSQVNDRGGLDSAQVGIIECSSAEADANGNAYADGLTPEEATVSAGEWMKDVWGVDAIVGPATSGRTLLAYNAWSEKDTLLISPSATSPELTPADGLEATNADPGLLWRTAPPDSFQGAVLASLALEEGRQNIGVIAQEGAYGDGLADVFIPAVGGETEKYSFDSGTALAQRITEASEAGHDALLVVSSDTNDIIDFFNAAGGVEALWNIRVFLPDGAFSDALLDDTDGVVQSARDRLFPNVRGTVPGLPTGSAFTNFISAYRAENDGEDPTVLPFTAQAYDAAWLALSGYAWAVHNEGGLSGIGAARGLLQISDDDFGEPLPLGPGSWTSIESRFGNGDSIDVQGASGPLDYGSDGETVGPLDIWDLDEDGGDWNLHRWCCVDVAANPTEGCVGSIDACEDHE